MSRKKGRQSRMGLFHCGNTRCPICLIPFTKDAVEAGLAVTLEHVPPKALSGSVRCLTCTDCNQSAGRSLDQAVALRNNAIRDRELGRGIKMEIDVCGTKHTTYFSPEGIAKDSLDSRIAISPNARRLVSELPGRKFLLLAELKRGPVWDVSKGITLTIKQPQPNRVAVSLLRSAYLLVFSLLGRVGYRYAESEAVRPIREQIMKPEDELVPSLLCDVSRLKAPNELIIMNNWQRPFCWLVKIGNMGVFLPHGGTAEHYRAVLEMPDQIKPIGLLGWHPSKFGTNGLFDLSLRKDSTQVGNDLFGQEVTIAGDGFERKCIVVNQQESLCTFMPSSPTVRRTGC